MLITKETNQQTVLFYKIFSCNLFNLLKTHNNIYKLGMQKIK